MTRPAGTDPSIGAPRFSEALRIQARVIAALVMREVHMRYGRKNIGFLWLMFEPILFAAGVIALRSVLPYGKSNHGIDLVPFLMTGYLPFLIFRNLLQRGMHCVQANHSVLYHRQVNLMDLYAARFILEIVGGIAAFVFGCGALTLLGFMEPPKDLIPIYAGLFFLIWFSAGFAALLSVGAEMHTLIEKISHPLSYLFIVISGCFFMVDWLPTDYQKVALWVPTVHCFELIRSGYFGASIRVHFDIPFLAGVCLAQTFFAIAAIRGLRKWVAVE
jgi:capsular polysaccharide transport system permease protein